MINDHSILVVRNPKKDLLNMLKLIIRTGSYGKQKVNMTIWVIIDSTLHLDKVIQTVETRKAKRTMKDVLDKELGIEFCMLFDIIIDVNHILLYQPVF